MRRLTLAGLVGAAALAGSLAYVVVAPSAPTTQVVIDQSRFLPSRMSVSMGTTVRFTVHNTDPIDHEFLIGDTDVQDTHERGTEPSHGARPGELSVPAGEPRTTTYRFDRPGLVFVGCHLPGHWDYGMWGTIEVRES